MCYIILFPIPVNLSNWRSVAFIPFNSIKTDHLVIPVPDGCQDCLGITSILRIYVKQEPFPCFIRILQQYFCMLNQDSQDFLKLGISSSTSKSLISNSNESSSIKIAFIVKFCSPFTISDSHSPPYHCPSSRSYIA